MKNGILALFALAFLVFAGCQRVEVVEQVKCTNVAGIKLYATRLLGFIDVPPVEYYVLEDGRMLERDSYYHRIENTWARKPLEYCESIYVPGKSTKPINLKRGTIGAPCPKEKCPELYSKSTGLPIPPPPTPTP